MAEEGDEGVGELCEESVWIVGVGECVGSGCEGEGGCVQAG